MLTTPAKFTGQFKCDSKCPTFATYKMCSHTIATAEVSGKLLTFIQWLNRQNISPNLTKLSMLGIPKGAAGKKVVSKSTNESENQYQHYHMQQSLLLIDCSPHRLLLQLLSIMQHLPTPTSRNTPFSTPTSFNAQTSTPSSLSAHLQLRALSVHHFQLLQLRALSVHHFQLQFLSMCRLQLQTLSVHHFWLLLTVSSFQLP